MSEPYTMADHRAYRERVEAAEAKEREQTKQRVDKENQKRLWISEGGTTESFEAAWPRIKSAMEAARVERTLEREEQARAGTPKHSRI